MCNKILAAIFIIIALVLAILATALQPSQLKTVIIISHFFDVMIPVLAVGALLRYLTYCQHAKMMNTVISACIIFIAVLVAILALTLSTQDINIVIVISRFFEVMLPILGVGALVKFLLSCNKNEEASN